MGWSNPPVPWAELERVLSGRPVRVVDPLVGDDGDGGDSPAWSRKRPSYTPPPLARGVSTVDYAELHCHSNFSFLDGASQPEELVEEAYRLGLTGIALTDHDGFYGVVRFSEAARGQGVPTVFGAELSLGLPGPQNGEPDPLGRHLLVLARNERGYARLSSAMADAHLAGGQKGRPLYDLEELAERAGGDWLLLTGCRKGPVPAALALDGTAGAARELDRLVALFGEEQVVVELTDHDQPDDDERNDELAALARRFGLPTVATNNVHYAQPGRRRLATALAAVRARRSLDEIDGWLPAASTAHLRSGEEMAARFGAYPGAVRRAAEIAASCAFDLSLVAPSLPDFDLPAGFVVPIGQPAEMAYLRWLTYQAAPARYGPPERAPAAYRQLDHELAIIDQLGYPGYFLVVWDIVQFCKRNNILCQGRGSAANSAVCYVLGITNADPIACELLFERFLAPERDGPPDIDVDIESDQREKVIQYVYDKHGRRHAAQVANVISYRPRSAVRDMAKALGYSPGQQDAWSKQIDRWGPAATVDIDDIPGQVVELANEVLKFPRHLGIHSGGMVICDRPVSEVCPVEHARMPNRTVLQWDKDDCAAVGLVKFDLLGLGMLSALHYALDLVAAYHGEKLELATIPPEDSEVYDMLCRADSIGVFQVESRAQMATLPRLKPRKFYDLVVEVALIRPGPIQGGSVHPYIRRANGQEEPTVPHPLLKKALDRTLGVPLFQEQLMQMAIDVAGFNAAEADELRRAMGSKRSAERMAKLRSRLYDGMAERGISGPLADQIFDKLSAFANFGFPESHAISFAHLVYTSSWLKRFYPAAFCAALLAAQPMGFYSPNSLVADARRHGVTVRRPDINASGVQATLEPSDDDSVIRIGPTADGPTGRAPSKALPECWGIGGPAVRLGIASVRQISDEVAERIVAERVAGGRYRDLADLAGRIGLSVAQLEALATADAFACFGLSRREALWAAGAAAQERPGRLTGTATGVHAPPLPGMEPVERTAADVWATGLSPDSHPAEFARDKLVEAGAVRIEELGRIRHGARVRIGGVVTHRQRPATAGGITFLNLEDETGMANVICAPVVWQRYRRVARTSPALMIRGRLERVDGVINVIAERFDPLDLSIRSTSRDFR